MLSKTRVALPRLISYILSFSTEETNNDVINQMFPSQVKSSDDFHFSCLKFGESRNINDFPEKLKSIFDPFLKDFVRHSSKKNFENDNNLSLYFSILYLLVNNFNKMPSRDQLNYITKVRDKLIIYISNNENMTQQCYDTMGWTKKDVMNSLIQFKTNKIITKLLADYFCINIFILNIIEDKIYVASDNDSYDIFRPNILLVFNNDIFEPLIYSDSHLIDYSSGPIKKLITVDKNFLILLDANMKEHKSPPFSINLSNIQKYIKPKEENMEKCDTAPPEIKKLVDLPIKDIPKPDSIKESPKDGSDGVENEYGEVIPDESDANAYIKDLEENNNSTIIASQLVFKISSKMKLDEIQTIAKKLNIVLEKAGSKKVKTKNELMDEINVILKK